jgi:hypothetical protein
MSSAFTSILRRMPWCYPDLDSLKAHVLACVSAYNFAKHLSNTPERLSRQNRFQTLFHRNRWEVHARLCCGL